MDSFEKLVLQIIVVSFFLNLSLTSELKILGGYPIEISEAPYMVKIEVNFTIGTSFCGGSIIDEKHILTAAHCFYAGKNTIMTDPARIRVRSGTKEFKGGELTEIEVVKIHERFRLDFGNFFYDIAIVKLAKALELDGVQRKAIKLSSNFDGLPGTEVYTAGWGDNPNDPLSYSLHKVDLKILLTIDCSLKWRREALALVLRFRQICALGPNSADACAGDSGGPLIRKSDDVQVGLVSYGGKCDAPKGLPGVYTRISNYITWIENHIKN